MSLVEKINQLCVFNKTNFSKLERKLEFGQGSIRKWDKSSPSVEKFQKVANYFGVSLDYLAGSNCIDPLSGLGEVYFRLAKGAKELELTDDDVDAILNLYQKYKERFQ